MKKKSRFTAAIILLLGAFAFSGCFDDEDSDGSSFIFGNTVVNLSAIPGVVVPVRGASPVTTAIDTEQYAGTITWSPADNPFAAETVYSAVIALTAKSGFTLSGVAENFFTVAGAATVTNAADSGTVIAVFPATGGEPVIFMSAVQTGGTPGTVDSTGLLLEFDVDPETLTENNITVTGATRGALSGTGTTRNLVISDVNVANGATVSVTVSSPAGYAITGTPQAAVVYRVTLANMDIGDDYRGGKIAYILQSGDPGYDADVPHGLIAATADQYGGSGIIWALPAYETTAVPGGTGTALGTGSANTDNIIAQNGAGTYAAGLARAYTGGGYTDWCLPSKDELAKLYINRGELSGFSNNYFWSSSEYNASNAWFQYFYDGTQGYLNKDDTYRVRAVRAF